MSRHYNNLSNPVPYLMDHLPPTFGPPRQLISNNPTIHPTANPASLPRAILVHAARGSKSASPTTPTYTLPLILPQSPVDAYSESSSSPEPYPDLDVSVPPPSSVPLAFPLPPALQPLLGHFDPSFRPIRTTKMPKAAAEKPVKKSKKDVDPNKPKR